MLSFKKGNTLQFKVSVADVDGNAITDLATASAIKCMVKENQKDADADALISKTVGSGITVDSPNTGDLTIEFDSADSTSLTNGFKYLAIQVEYASGDIQEISLQFNNKCTENIEIKQDVIR